LGDQKHSFAKKWSYNVWTEPPSFLSELTAPSSGVALQEGQVLLEAGVLAFRRNHGDLEILLVSKKRSKNWGSQRGGPNRI